MLEAKWLFFKEIHETSQKGVAIKYRIESAKSHPYITKRRCHKIPYRISKISPLHYLIYQLLITRMDFSQMWKYSSREILFFNNIFSSPSLHLRFICNNRLLSMYRLTQAACKPWCMYEFFAPLLCQPNKIYMRPFNILYTIVHGLPVNAVISQ